MVAFDAASSAHVAASGGTTLSWTHTPVGTPTAVGVFLQNYEIPDSVSGVTYGGVAMTQALVEATGASGSGSSSVYIFGLPNPASGAQTVVITFSATGAYCEAGAVTVTGSDTSTCFSNVNGTNGNTHSSAVASGSVTSASGELVVDVVGSSNGSGTLAAGGSQTVAWGPLTDGGNQAAGSYLAGSAGSVSTSWTLQNADKDWAVGAASFKSSGATDSNTYTQNFSVLGPSAYPRPPYASFAGKPASGGDIKTFVRVFSVLNAGGYPRPPYGSFAGKPASGAGTGAVIHAPPFFCTMGCMIGSPANPPS